MRLRETEGQRTVLAPYRVLDLTTELGVFCGKMLATLGCEVIKIEQPQGDPMRKVGPFWHDSPHPERSLFWFQYNVGKKSITLNIETQDGREVFKRLVADADFVLESFEPGYLDSLGLGYAALSKVNPRIILTSVSPFGQSGPYQNYRSYHLILSALAGVVYTSGWEGRPPLQLSLPVSNIFAGAVAAVGTLLAHHYRQRTGEGQYVDVSGQESLMMMALPTYLAWRSHNIIARRDPSGAYTPGVRKEQRLFPCQDGWVNAYVTYWPGRVEMREWLNSEGIGTELHQEEWKPIFEGAPMTEAQKECFYQLFEQFALKHTKTDLFAQGQKRGIQVCPVNNAAEAVADAHLKARHYFVPVAHPELETTILYQGAPFRMSEAAFATPRRAPLIGEHNQEIYQGELGLSAAELSTLKSTGVI